MCRMLAYYGKNKDYLRKMANCLVKASLNDPLINESHSDGWGIVAYNNNKIIYYRSSNPIFQDINTLNDVINSLDGELKVIIHARKASEKVLVSSFYSHPYLETTSTHLFFLAHNGSVDKYRLGETLGLDPSLMVDSELIARYIAIHGLKEVDRLREFTKSALNLLILEIDRKSKSSQIYFHNYYRKDIIVENEEYYKLYHNKGAVYSSSLAYTGCEKGEEVEFGKLMKLS
ncbi:class II glutamine amidotransferase [Sulfolobus tengchongensis]|uniref:Class II glutamine amidotransferase n=1 Tax=Sulfolobus tengchongensis TaxID=207809 RepID=A0AAX4KX55_9CREN